MSNYQRDPDQAPKVEYGTDGDGSFRVKITAHYSRKPVAPYRIPWYIHLACLFLVLLMVITTVAEYWNMLDGETWNPIMFYTAIAVRILVLSVVIGPIYIRWFRR